MAAGVHPGAGAARTGSSPPIASMATRWSRGVPMSAVMAEMYGKAEGCSGGRGGSMHLFDARHQLLRRQRHRRRRAAAGRRASALADRMRGRGRASTACFFGEGAVAEGEFHEAMNLAALWDLPVLFVCENNGYAMGTALDAVRVRDRHPRQGRRLRDRGAAWWTAWTSSRWRPRRAARHPADPRDRQAAFPRMPHLPLPGAFDVRRAALPRQGRGRGLAQAGADRPLPGLAAEKPA